MINLIIFIIINLLYLSKEVKEIPLYQSCSAETGEYYLDISRNKKSDIISLTIIFATFGFLQNPRYNLSFAFSDSLNCSNLTQIKHSSRRIAPISYGSDYKRNDYYYNLKMDKRYKYLLLRVIKGVNCESLAILHSNEPPCSAVQIVTYAPKIIRGDDYVFLTNEYKENDYIYFLFSFENKNITNINGYNIYFNIESYFNDKAFLNKEKKYFYSPFNKRLKNNRYSFYYKLPIYTEKAYICLKPGTQTLENNRITVTHMRNWPYELKKYNNITTNADDYIYNDIKNIPIGNEIYIKVTFYEKENLNIKFKLSDENFYDDYEDMNKLSPKNTDVENNLNVQYYNIKKVNNSNFLLLVIPGFKNIKYNIYQTIEDEYQQKMKKIEEAEKAKKRTIIISVTVPIGALIIIIIIIIIVKKRKLKKIEFNEGKQEYPEKPYTDDDNLSAAMLPTYPTSY